MSALAPGAVFGDYEILSELGGGGMGRVYRAKDRTLERVVAVKTLAPQYGGDPSFVQRFLNEARAAARLNHPNIVQIYAFGSVEGTYYLAMEYVDGHSLGAHLKRGPFAEHDAVSIARHAARALGVAHADGLVHRDIKPDNIMLTAKGTVKIVDLGIAKKMGDAKNLTMTGLAVGTPHYVAPEQARGERDVDARADVYALGATLYHLVTGSPPFDGDSGAVVMMMHLVKPLPDPRSLVPSLSDGLCRVIGKMMAKRREERYEDADALDRDLYRVQMGEAPGAPPLEGGSAAATISEASMKSAVGLSREGTVAASSAPSATPAPASFDSAVLRRVEEAMASAVGPMAKVLVRRQAKSSPDLEALCGALAEQVPDGAREAFRARCLAAGRGVPTPPPVPTVPPRTPGAGVGAVSLVTPGPPTASGAAFAISEEELRRLEAELARHVGPLARVLVKKAVKSSASADEAIAKLEAEIAAPEARKAFRSAVTKAVR